MGLLGVGRGGLRVFPAGWTSQRDASGGVRHKVDAGGGDGGGALDGFDGADAGAGGVDRGDGADGVAGRHHAA
jgi:hypothetical protein